MARWASRARAWASRARWLEAFSRKRTRAFATPILTRFLHASTGDATPVRKRNIAVVRMGQTVWQGWHIGVDAARWNCYIASTQLAKRGRSAEQATRVVELE